MIILPEKIITNNASDEILTGWGIKIENGKISEMISPQKLDEVEDEILQFNKLVLIPGFVQTHIHLCQTLFRGLADGLELLDWLQGKIFPMENAHNAESLRISARLGINELLHSGTTTLMDMGTINYQEILFYELINSGIRAVAGKCMVDRNELLPEFCESTTDSLKTTFELAKEFHEANEGRIKYGFAPRFVLSCSEELLKETSLMMKDFPGSMYHTHSSENKSEIAEVRRLRGMENIEYFDHIGVLGRQTLLAHGIHVNDAELGKLKSTDTRIAHCPSSNLKLASGIAAVPEYLEKGINVSLGADGAPCNNELNIFTEMRLASLIQKPLHGPKTMDAKTIFKMATIGGSKALNLGDEIGSIEVGKKADLVLLDLNLPSYPLMNDDDSLYSAIVYSAGKESVKHVMVEGEWKVMDGHSLLYDPDELRILGQEQLTDLLKRI